MCGDAYQSGVTSCEDSNCPCRDFMKNSLFYQLQADECTTNFEETLISQTESVIQTVGFTDNAEGVLVDQAPVDNPVAQVDNTDDISLGKFLSRPFLLDTLTWTTSTSVGVLDTLNPWLAFFNQTLVKRKIENYAFFRGRLHLKFVLNGTPFQYGMLRCCYSPLLGYVADKIHATTSVADSLIPYSQQPGLYLYPQTNAGGEMVLPFFYHKNWLDLTSSSDVSNMGTMKFVVYNQLYTAVTGGTTTVNIKVYGWMTDVQLMGATTKLTLQGDEYGNGPVSRPATAIASVANYLSNLPIIGKFAKATSIGASSVSAIASLFGFTNTPVIDPVHTWNPSNAPPLASAHIGSAVQKFTLDPKQELTIDPSIHGLPSEDELTIPYLVSKESFLSGVQWTTSAVAGTTLFNLRLNPMLYEMDDILNSVSTKVGNLVSHTPMSYVASMFQHWRGDIIVRVKITCSKFHKGRLKFQYDPLGDISTTDSPENAVYTQILDIGEQDDVEFRIPYHQALAWSKVDNTTPILNWNQGTSLLNRVGTDNGTFSVTTVTALTAPSSGAITLNIFVRGAENLEFANPVSNIGFVSNNTVPSLFALQGEEKTDLTATQHQMGTNTQMNEHRYEQNYGECICSLRNLLRRYTLLDHTLIESKLTGIAYAWWLKLLKRMPYSPGFYGSSLGPLRTIVNKIVAASGTSFYGPNSMHPTLWVSSLFLGYRGGVNFVGSVISDKYGYVDDINAFRVTNSNGNATYRRAGHVAVTLPVTDSNNSQNMVLGRVNFINAGASGSAIASSRVNNTIQFNIPDYNNFNFSLVDPSFYGFGSSTDGTDIQGAEFAVGLKNLADSTDTYPRATVRTYQAIGVDFTCHFFLCCPSVFYSVNAPTAV